MQPWKLILLAGLLLDLSGCGRAPEPAGPPIRVGAYYWPGMFWVDIAHRKGWFREAGLNVERVDTNADYIASFDDLVNGKLDIIGFTLFDLVRYSAKGKDLVGFLASDYSSGAEALVARHGIAGVRGLAGRRLGLPQGTYVEYLWSVVAEREGLRPEAVRLVDVPGEKAHEELAKGSVDAVLTWEPFAGQALAAVKGRKLFDSSQVPGVLWSVYSVRREFADRRGADLAAFTRVWRRASLYLREHPDEALAIVAEVNRKPLAEVREFMQQDHILGLRENQTALSFAPGFESLHGTARRMNDFMIDKGIATQRIDTARLFAPEHVRALTAGETAR